MREPRPNPPHKGEGLNRRSVVISLSAALLALIALPLTAHEAPKGWAYDRACCSGIDCREIAAADVAETWAGYQLKRSNEIVPFGDARIKDSPDGLFHWCTVGGTDAGRTICLYVPPRGY